MLSEICEVSAGYLHYIIRGRFSLQNIVSMKGISSSLTRTLTK